MDLQSRAVASVKGRGFWRPENVPGMAFSRDVTQRIVGQIRHLGGQARLLRLAEHYLPGRDQSKERALYAAQLFRLMEEIGEMVTAIESGNHAHVEAEISDVYIVLAQIAEMQGVYLDSAVLAKLRADEARGYMHRGE